MFEKYINKRLIKLEKYLEPIDWENWNMGKVNITIEFYPIMYSSKDYIAFIPTGSKDMPAGISTLGDIYILFVDSDRKQKSFYVHVDSIRDYMKKNIDKLKQKQNIDRDFKHIGYDVDVKDIVTSFEESLYGVISP